MTLDQNTIGIDISKAHLDVFDARDGSSRRLANSAAGVAALAAELQGAPVLVVMEATGIYDQALRRGLGAAGIAYVRVNPGRARDFARASGRLAKTDSIDAAMLAAMGAALRLQPQVQTGTERCHPRFKAAYQRLLAAGKPKKLALIAIARKLIVILNAMMMAQKPFTASA